MGWGRRVERGDCWGVSEAGGKKYCKIGSEGVLGRSEPCQNKRNRNIIQRQFGKRNWVYSSLHGAGQEGGWLASGLQTLLTQRCPVICLTAMLQLAVSGWGRTLKSQEDF